MCHFLFLDARRNRAALAGMTIKEGIERGLAGTARFTA
jgi:hypothetical protein